MWRRVVIVAVVAVGLTACNRQIEYSKSDMEPVVLHVPVGGTTYVDIELDGINTDLVETNESTIWRFNDAYVSRTSAIGDTRAEKDSVYYTDNETGYTITVGSDEKFLDVTWESFSHMKPYDGGTVELPEDKRTTIDVVDNAELPDTLTEYDETGYINIHFKYCHYDDALNEVLARMNVLGTGNVDWWYEDSTWFIVKSGTECAAIRKETYTSNTVITSNREDYLLRVVQDGGITW